MSESNDLQSLHDTGRSPATVEEVRSVGRYQGFCGDPVDEFDEGGDEFPLYRYWLLLRRHKAVLLLAGVAGALVGFLFSLPQTPIYEAATTVEFQSFNEGFLGTNAVNPMEQGQGAARTDLATQVQIIQSRSVVSKAREDVEKAATADNSAPTGRIEAWRRAFGLEEESAEARRDLALSMAAESVQTVPNRDSRIVRISTESTDPRLAAAFANSLATRFIDESIEAQWEATQYTEDWLERQLEDLRIKLEEGEDRLQAAANASGLVFTSETMNVAQERLQQLQMALSEARADRIVKQSQFELAKSSPTESLPDVLDRPSLAQYQSQLTELRQNLANLQTTYTDSYPQVKQLKAQISELEEALARGSQNVVSRIQNEYEQALRRETLMQADYDNQSKLVSQRSRQGIQYNILAREVETTRQLYEDLLQKGKEDRLAAVMKASPVRVVDEAVVPDRPVKPDHLRNSILGALFGMGLGVAFVIGREKVVRTIKNPGDTEFYLSSPELGFIPKFDGSQAGGRKLYVRLAAGSSKSNRSRQELSSGNGSAKESSEPAVVDQFGLTTPNKDQAPVDSERISSADLFTWHDSQSWASECVQATLTSILFSGQNGDVPRKLVITSSSPAEGKSTVVANLAVALAETSHSVLIIDADMRRPRQHQIFDVSNEQGLSDLLRRPEEVDSELLQALAKQTAVPGVMLLSSGPGTKSGSNLLHSDRTRELLKVARENFDWVLIDTPPMSQLSDARLLGRLAGAVALVIKAGSTTRDATTICEERLRKDGTRVLGTILNQWQPDSSDPGYFKDYYAHRNDYTEG